MGMGFAPTWLRQVSPLLHMATLTTGNVSLFWVETRCGEGEYCWLLCYQTMSDRLYH